MYDADVPPAFDANNPSGPPDDWSGEHVRMLRELAELGMALARATARQALAQVDETDPSNQANAAVRGDPGLAFARIARAVRLTLSLEARTREGVVARNAPPAFDFAGAAARVREKLRAVLEAPPPAPRGAEARRVVEQAFEAEHPDADGLDERISEAFDRLEEDGRDPDGRPIGETVARICRDLGVTPDWTRWANEPWAVEEARTGARGSPYAARSTGPPP